jgi:hypothetical protein
VLCGAIVAAFVVLALRQLKAGCATRPAYLRFCDKLRRRTAARPSEGPEDYAPGWKRRVQTSSPSLRHPVCVASAMPRHRPRALVELQQRVRQFSARKASRK